MVNEYHQHVEQSLSNPTGLIQSYLLDGSERSALVEYWRGPDRVFAFVLLPELSHPLTVPIQVSDQEVCHLLSLVQEELKQPLDPKWMMWHELATRIALPIIDLCRGRDIVYVSPHGDLFGVPFHAIPVADRILDDISPIVYVASGLMLPFIGKGPSLLNRHNKIVVIGNPSRNLPYAEDEARGVASLFQTSPILGHQATLSMLSTLRDIDILHIAAHGYFDRREPLRSGLVLYDGIVTVEKIRKLHLRASLVILSACETALGDYKSGEGLASLASAFLAAGASNVLATLWLTHDESASCFIRDFYLALLRGSTPVKALVQARGRQRQDDRWTHPFHWAPYILVGSGL